MNNDSSMRIGVYICHCGANIAGTVDVDAVAVHAETLPHVVVARTHPYLCSATGQQLMQRDIRDLLLQRVVVAACSPRLHEETFRSLLVNSGLNPFLLAMANIREQAAWIVRDMATGTGKAQSLVSAAAHRVVWQTPLSAHSVGVTAAAVVVGGGIAGIQASLAIADAGHKVFLVEKDTSIGGRMAQLDKTFPTLDCSSCILTPKMVEVARHPNITLLTNAQVTRVSGYVGNFSITVHQKPRYVKTDACSACGDCAAVCPVLTPHEFDQRLSRRPAIYRLFAQAVPGAFAIDKRGSSPCRSACPAGVNVHGFVSLVHAGKFGEALALIHEQLPFPGVCGRVCTHPCQDSCARGARDRPLAIAALERFVADWGMRQSRGQVHAPAKATANAENVAVIGSGPAGLSCAYSLARRGYGVTLFEALPVAGGTMISALRTPADVVLFEIDHVRAAGVRIVTGCPLGRDFNLDDLFARGYAAVFLAMGAPQEKVSSLSGIELAASGTIRVDRQSCQTSRPGVFAGGAAVAGQTSVIEAVAWGNRGAGAIMRYLRPPDASSQGEDTAFGKGEWSGPGSTPSSASTMTWATQAPADAAGLDAKEARREASRCLDCSVCSECMECVKVCGAGAIDLAMPDVEHQLEVGAIVVATGHQFFVPSHLPQYHYAQLPNILDSMEFERMCSASGPTGGEIVTHDGRTPQSIVFIHCVGSRDAQTHPYCSRLCCMHAMKQARLARERTGAAVYELYIDIRAPGKGYEEFYEEVQRAGVVFVRGRNPRVTSLNGRLLVTADDSCQESPITLPADIVVLVTGIEPNDDAGAVAKTLHITRDKDGFFLEAHPKLLPFRSNTDGIFLAGSCQAPRDIPDTVSHASAAAAQVMSLLGRGNVVIEPAIAEINAQRCSGCQVCNALCAYGAISYDPAERVSTITAAQCRGCGVCVAACPAGAVQAHHYTDAQIMAEIEGILASRISQP